MLVGIFGFVLLFLLSGGGCAGITADECNRDRREDPRSCLSTVCHGEWPEAGDVPSLVILSAFVLILLVVTCYVLLKSFLQIATGTSETAKVKYKEKKVKKNSVPGERCSPKSCIVICPVPHIC